MVLPHALQSTPEHASNSLVPLPLMWSIRHSPPPTHTHTIATLHYFAHNTAHMQSLKTLHAISYRGVCWRSWIAFKPCNKHQNSFDNSYLSLHSPVCAHTILSLSSSWQTTTVQIIHHLLHILNAEEGLCVYVSMTWYACTHSVCASCVFLCVLL